MAPRVSRGRVRDLGENATSGGCLRYPPMCRVVVGVALAYGTPLLSVVVQTEGLYRPCTDSVQGLYKQEIITSFLS